MGDRGQSVINPCDSQSPIIAMRDTQETNTPVAELVDDASAGQQCEGSSTTDGRTLPEPIVMTEANISGGSGNKKPQQQQHQQQTIATSQTARAGGASKFHQFRAPQQCVQTKKKMWNKRQKCHHHLKYLHHAQQLQQQQLHHQQTQQQVYKKMLSHRVCNGVGGGCNACNGVGNGGNGAPPLAHHPIFCSRTKFFLPDKRPRKEVIIPPTKFLLGGNISDPLNLNSLQNEANSSNNNTPATTPRQSPITTPPKVEVIIPPNIHDPLHLLDPVDTMEYEKQLTSPMKRKSKSSKSKHRHRKKKPKRKRIESTNSTLDDGEKERCTANSGTLSTELIADTLVADSCCAQHNSSAEFDDKAGENNETHFSRESAEPKASDSGAGIGNVDGGGSLAQHVDKVACCGNHKMLPTLMPPAVAHTSVAAASGGSTTTITVCEEQQQQQHHHAPSTSDRESIKKDLRLDLNDVSEQYHHHVIGGGNRKRKVSEGACSAKSKFRRMDSMDKIVSPVVPQPGAWKRPPRLVPSGARKNSRHRSTSVSETELLSPIDDSRTITDTDSIRADTPDIDAVSKHVDTASIGSPLSTTSVNTIDNAVITEKPPSTALTNEAAAAADSSANVEKMPKFRPDGAKYQYGNYDRYTGYRLLNEFMDVRLQVFQRNAELFRGKDILDIGCNVGHMTISIARNLAPKSILGIDIDKNLIARARKNLSLYVRIPKQVKAKVNATAKAETETHTETDEQPPPVTDVINNDKESQSRENKGIKQQRNRKNRRKNNQNHQHHQQLQEQQQHNHHHYYHHHHHFHHHHLHHRHHPHQQSIESQLFPISFPLTYGGIPEVNAQLQSGQTDQHQATTSNSSTSNAADFPKNVFFRQTNYVLEDEALLNNDTQQYDLIVCLSVTKWIHLNFGDNGLKTAFKRMFNQLRPGGKLILEAQNWASYKKKKNLTETIYNNYRNIEFFPNKFHEYLLSNEVGFSHSYTLGVPRHMSKGFSRPIQLYAKGDFTPNHVRWSDAYYPQTPYESYRGIYATMPRLPHPVPSGGGGNSGSYSCRQTPMHQSTSQYYNPFESDSYQPSYDDVNQLYVFASPLYQTVWSPPASLRNSSSHTPVFGSVREIENEDGGAGPPFHRHVYPPNDEISSPNANGAFNSIRDADTDDSQTHSNVRHVYANCESSSSPHVNDSETQDGLEDAPPAAHRNAYEQNGCGDSNES